MSDEALIQLIGLGQAAMLLVGIAMVGWLLKISNDIGSIKSTLQYHDQQKMDSTKVHDELFERMRKVERGFDQCPNCHPEIQQVSQRSASTALSIADDVLPN